ARGIGSHAAGDPLADVGEDLHLLVNHWRAEGRVELLADVGRRRHAARDGTAVATGPPIRPAAGSTAVRSGIPLARSAVPGPAARPPRPPPPCPAATLGVDERPAEGSGVRARPPAGAWPRRRPPGIDGSGPPPGPAPPGSRLPGRRAAAPAAAGDCHHC